MDKIMDSYEKNVIVNLKKNFELQDEDFKVDERGLIIELDLHPTYLKIIPKMIRALPQLQIFHIHETDISKIEELEILSHLEELHLYNNQIKRIEGLENLSQLKILNLAYNQINKIEGLENLSQLQKLFLEGNRIGKIENLENLTRLQVLMLEANQIKKIDGLDNLLSLTELDLSDNKIQKIEGLGRLFQLKILNLRLNEIRKIEGLGDMFQIKTLDIRLNKIRKIEGLEYLSQLKTLDLRVNKISKIEGLENCLQLEDLRLDKDYLIEEDQIIFEKGIKEIIGQYKNKELKEKKILIDIYIPKLKDKETKNLKTELESMSLASQKILRKEILSISDNKRSNIVKDLLKNRKRLKNLLIENIQDLEKLLIMEDPSFPEIFQKMEAAKIIYEALGDDDKAQLMAIEIQKILDKFDSFMEKRELSSKGGSIIQEAKALQSHNENLKASLLYKKAARFFIEIGNHQQANQLRELAISCEQQAK
ncbi:MAG: leucine-rich repeat domain-containing protein [Candidatus Helarchaeota archaeon]|nr:leucine-rich repeat domain-containing protein [Candidatus Helarchaeota archaeon]